MSPTFRTLTAAAALCAVSAASAQETFKVAYIDPLSGPFPNVGELMLTHSSTPSKTSTPRAAYSASSWSRSSSTRPPTGRCSPRKAVNC